MTNTSSAAGDGAVTVTTGPRTSSGESWWGAGSWSGHVLTARQSVGAPVRRGLPMNAPTRTDLLAPGRAKDAAPRVVTAAGQCQRGELHPNLGRPRLDHHLAAGIDEKDGRRR